jgi:hypothetical protein
MDRKVLALTLLQSMIDCMIDHYGFHLDLIHTKKKSKRDKKEDRLCFPDDYPIIFL